MSAEIDWEEQWAVHAPLFKDGKAHIKLPTHNMIELLPGPGFGDFSHPTTQLMVDLMTCFVQDETVFDIGCGSGILSIAAGKMGAKKIFVCDIEPTAIEHTKKNATFNQLDIIVGSPPLCRPVILMNMIASEQKIAWQKNMLPFTTLISSGILNTEKKDYLTFAYSQGWQLLHEANLNGWLGFVFKEKIEA
jgi:ribosomal protein L11 methyltransferase